MSRWHRIRLWRAWAMVVLSATVFVGLAVLWPRSAAKTDAIGVIAPGGYVQAVGSWRGRVVFFVSNVRIENRAMGGVELLSEASGYRIDGFIEELKKNLAFPYEKAPFLYGGGRAMTLPSSPEYVLFTLPHWLVMIPFALLPLRTGRRRWVRWRRKRNGLCLECGYDLHHSPGRCPECGKEPQRR